MGLEMLVFWKSLSKINAMKRKNYQHTGKILQNEKTLFLCQQQQKNENFSP